MGSLERSKKKVQLWKKAIVHFSLCFVLGFFTGFAPTAKTTMFQYGNGNGNTLSHPASYSLNSSSSSSSSSSQSIAKMQHHKMASAQAAPNTTTITDSSEAEEVKRMSPKSLVIIVTPTSTKDELRLVLLSRLADTLRLVAPPLLWVVVEQEQQSESSSSSSSSSQVSELLRKTGIMYRHLVFKENFTDVKAEMDHQRNVALNHIEHHKLSGIVHFSDLSNVYDLTFFEEIREIEVFGSWPMALLSANRKRVVIEGPVCDSSQVIGWHLRKLHNRTDQNPPIHISTFAFNSSILWDPERWGRTSSLQDTSKDSLKFVRDEVLQEETKLKGIPSESCSRILLWFLDISRGILPLSASV